MPRHRQTFVKVNAPVDEGIAELISTLSEIEGLETLESCEGDFETDAFIVFRLGDWRKCGALLFEGFLPLMSPDLRSAVSLSLRAYDTDNALASISLDASAVRPMTDCVRRLLAAPESASVLVTRDAHSEAIPEIITTARGD